MTLLGGYPLRPLHHASEVLREEESKIIKSSQAGSGEHARAV